MTVPVAEREVGTPVLARGFHTRARRLHTRVRRILRQIPRRILRRVLRIACRVMYKQVRVGLPFAVHIAEVLPLLVVECLRMFLESALFVVVIV